MRFSEFKRKPPPPGHVYLFVCQDDFLVDESQQVWAGFFEGDWGVERMSSKEFDAISGSDLVEWARTPPLFGPSRLIMVTGPGKLTKQRLAAVEPVADLDRSSLKIVFTMPSRPGRGKTPFPLIEIDALRPGDTVRWLTDRFGLSGEVARYLVDNLGAELLTLKQEVEKLQTYVAGERAIDLTDVDQLIFRSEQYGPFELDDAFLARDYPRSIRVLGSMLEEGVEPILILSKLMRVWRQIFVAKALEGRGSASQLSQIAGVPQWKASQFLAAARKFDWDRVVSGFAELVGADLAFKSTSTHPEYYFDVMLWKLIGQRTPAA
jgi:DNA polymerase-3 subunit delta